ncbi:hypothetical protein BGZ46_003763 [Entomortierella lignicola]|nr:hypothetical protein BGZ46_003763 [Entomortierella lignicola]
MDSSTMTSNKIWIIFDGVKNTVSTIIPPDVTDIDGLKEILIPEAKNNLQYKGNITLFLAKKENIVKDSNGKFDLEITDKEELEPDSILSSIEGLTDINTRILVKVPQQVPEDATKFLLAEGMVSVREDTQDRNVVLECSAPILRSLMIKSIASPAALRLSEDVPDDKRLDPHWLLLRTIEVSYLYELPLYLFIVHSTKPYFLKNLCIWHLYSTQSLNADDNPSEYAFQSEFSTILRHLIPLAYPTLKYKILVESKERGGLSDGRQRLDFLVCNGGTIPAYGFELVVATSKAEYDEHCERAKQYGLVHGCDMFMVNLCPKKTLTKYFGGKQEDITPVNVVIDRNSGCGVIKYDGGVEKRVTIFGSQWKMMFLERTNLKI